MQTIDRDPFERPSPPAPTPFGRKECLRCVTRLHHVATQLPNRGHARDAVQEDLSPAASPPSESRMLLGICVSAGHGDCVRRECGISGARPAVVLAHSGRSRTRTAFRTSGSRCSAEPGQRRADPQAIGVRTPGRAVMCFSRRARASPRPLRSARAAAPNVETRMTSCGRPQPALWTLTLAMRQHDRAARLVGEHRCASGARATCTRSPVQASIRRYAGVDASVLARGADGLLTWATPRLKCSPTAADRDRPGIGSTRDQRLLDRDASTSVVRNHMLDSRA